MFKEKMGTIFKITILIILVLSIFLINDFTPKLVEYSSAYSSWNINNETILETSKLINCSADATGNISLSLQTKYITDSFFNTDNISYHQNILVDSLSGGVKPLIINKNFNLSDNDFCNDMRPTTDGGYVLVGRTRTTKRESIDVLLIKTDKFGNMEWNNTFGGNDYDSGYSVQQTTDGGFIIVGETDSFGDPGSNAWLIKTNEKGNMQWNQVHGDSEYDCGNSVIQTKDGGYAFVGFTYSYGHGNSDVWVVKTNGQGEIQWDEVFGDIDNDYGNAIQQTSDNGYIVIGTKHSFETYSNDIFLIKLDSFGNSNWNITFGGTETEWGEFVQQTSDRGYLLVGTSYQQESKSFDLWVIKTKNNGYIEWQKIYGGWDSEYGIFGQEILDGGYVIIADTFSYGSGNRDIWVIKINETGGLQWSEAYGGIANDYGVVIHQTADEGFIIGGNKYYYDSRGYDFWLLKIDKFGNKIPNALMNSVELPIDDYVYSINSFNYNATLSNGTNISISFSPDNITWYDSTGKLNGSDPFLDGNNTLNLKPLANNWSKIYYMINFSTNTSKISELNWINISYLSYHPVGTIEGQPSTSGENVIWKTLTWDSTEPEETDIRFQIRTSKTKANLSFVDYVGPDGNRISYYNNSGEAIWAGHYNEQWIQYKAYLFSDTGKLTPILNHITINYNRCPNAPILKSPSGDIWMNNDTPMFNWFYDDPDSEVQYGFQWQAAEYNNFSTVKYDSGVVTSSLESYSHSKIIGDGIWYWRVRTQDVDGDWGPFSSNYSIKIDMSTPDIDHEVVTNGIAGKPLTITAKVTDKHSGVNSVQLCFKGSFEPYYTVFSMKGKNDVYSATISGDFVKDKKIGYYIIAMDNSNPPNKIYYTKMGKTRTEPTPLSEIKIEISESLQDESDNFQWTLILIIILITVVIITIVILISHSRKKAKPKHKVENKPKSTESEKPKREPRRQKSEKRK